MSRLFRNVADGSGSSNFRSLPSAHSVPFYQYIEITVLDGRLFWNSRFRWDIFYAAQYIFQCFIMDIYITSHHSVSSCCSISESSFFLNEHRFIKKFRATPLQLINFFWRKSSNPDNIRNGKTVLFLSLRAISKRPSKRPSRDSLFTDIIFHNTLHVITGPPPYHKRYGHLRQVSLGGKAVKDGWKPVLSAHRAFCSSCSYSSVHTLVYRIK